MKDRILKEYSDAKQIYDLLGEKIKILLPDLFKESAIIPHQITSRTKTLNSLSKKIDDKKGKYASLLEITDICGLRIITYLESDVDLIAKILENEFDIDWPNSIDKRKLKSDQFGYRSLHYVATLNSDRLKLTENKKFEGIKIEFQIRSILQHAWAEIEHDLGYKGELAIPENLKRHFNRLAALLETADIEFDRLKSELSKYEDEIGDIIKEKPNEVTIDQASLASFMLSNSVFEEARKIIAKNTGCTFSEKFTLSGELERFEFLEIKTIGELEDLIENSREHYLKFVDEFTNDMQESSLTISLPLFYFQHFLASRSEDEEYIEDYFSYGSVSLGGPHSARDFIEYYNKTK